MREWWAIRVFSTCIKVIAALFALFGLLWVFFMNGVEITLSMFGVVWRIDDGARLLVGLALLIVWMVGAFGLYALAQMMELAATLQNDVRGLRGDIRRLANAINETNGRLLPKDVVQPVAPIHDDDDYVPARPQTVRPRQPLSPAGIISPSHRAEVRRRMTRR